MSERKLTFKQYGILDTAITEKEKMGWFLSTNRQTRRADVIKLVSMGLMKSAGQCYMADGDGFMVQPERLGEGFEATKLGRKRRDQFLAARAASTSPAEGAGKK